MNYVCSLLATILFYVHKVSTRVWSSVYWEAKEFARKTTNKSKLRDYFSDFHFQNEDLKDIFFDDLGVQLKLLSKTQDYNQ